MLFAADEGILHIPDDDEESTRRINPKLINEKRYTCSIPISPTRERDGHINSGI
jgi:hypothetical protein